MIDSRRTDVYVQMAERTRAIYELDSDEIVVQEIVSSALELVPGAQFAGITVLRRRGQLDTAAAGPHPAPALFDWIQMRHQQGPCLDAAHDEIGIVQVDDLTTEERWPEFRRDALTMTPVRSLISFALSSDGQTLGILTVSAEQTHAFSAEAVDIAHAYAIHAALAWGTVRRSRQFRSAFASREAISQARGILMARYDLTADDAFATLNRLSKESQVPVAEVARRLAAENTGPHLKLGDPPRLPIRRVGDGAVRRQNSASTMGVQMIREATRC